MTEPHTPAKTRILLMRHAETAAPDLFHGAESDIGLGARGELQAKEAGNLILPYSPSAVYCSGMRRSMETAEPIAAALKLLVFVEADLHERKMGPLSGCSRVEGWPIYEETKRRWMAGELDYTHKEGESYAQIRNRVVPAIQRLADRHGGQTIVIVGHGVANRVIIASLVEGLSPANFDDITIEFVQITELVRSGEVWSIG